MIIYNERCTALHAQMLGWGNLYGFLLHCRLH